MSAADQVAERIVFEYVSCMAGRTTSFALGEHFDSFVESKVSEGRFASAGEVLRAGLRLLEEQEARFASVRTALIEGEASGAATPFDFDLFLEGKRGAETPET